MNRRTRYDDLHDPHRRRDLLWVLVAAASVLLVIAWAWWLVSVSSPAAPGTPTPAPVLPTPMSSTYPSGGPAVP